MSARRALALCAGALLASAAAQAAPAAEPEPPLRPDRILGAWVLRTPPIDAVPPCHGVRVEASHAALLEQALVDPESALRRAAELEKKGAPEAGLLAAVLDARLAQSPQGRMRARERLRHELVEPSDEALRTCGRLELARLELALKLYPEAAASARRMSRAPADLVRKALHDAGRFLRAEALYLAGRAQDAAPVYAKLAEGPEGSLALAAALRKNDLRFDRGATGETLEEYTRLFEGAAFGAPPEAWALRVAEAAIARGEIRTARSWLARFVEREPGGELETVAWIRLADLRATEGRGDASDALLEKLASEHEGTRVGLLAGLRRFDLRLVKLSAEETTRELEQAIAAAPEPRLAAYGRLILGRGLLDDGDIDAAIPILLRVSFDVSTQAIVQRGRSQLTRAVRMAAEDRSGEDHCERLVRRLGGIRSLLIRGTPDPEPFRRLGECYEALGIPDVALSIYRDLIRGFGRRGASELALPIARASFAAGDRATARATASARVAAGAPAPAAWRLLLAEVKLAFGEPESAAALLTGLLAEQRESGEADVHTLALLARAASEAPPSESRRSLLSQRLREHPGWARPAAAERLAQAALVTASLHRRASEPELARTLYERALGVLPPGAASAEAAYWIGALHPEREPSQAALVTAAAAPTPAPFGRLAESRLRSQQLVDRMAGRLPAAP